MSWNVVNISACRKNFIFPFTIFTGAARSDEKLIMINGAGADGTIRLFIFSCWLSGGREWQQFAFMNFKALIAQCVTGTFRFIS